MRVALLGSPGRGLAPRLGRKLITGTPAQRLNDVAATYAAVPAGNHLDISVYVPGFGTVTEVVTFTGAEATRAAFLAALQAQLTRITAVASGATQILFATKQLGSLAKATVTAATSAAVLASLGLTAPRDFDPSFGVHFGPRTYARSCIAYFGGTNPEIAETPQRSVQHAATLRGGRVGIGVVVDRQVATTVLADSVRFKPDHTPIP